MAKTIHFLVILFVTFIIYNLSLHCPCEDTSLETLFYSNQRNITSFPLHLCLNISYSSSLFKDEVGKMMKTYKNYNENLLFNVIDRVSQVDTTNNCNVLIELNSDYKHERILCPGECYPLPTSKINDIRILDLISFSTDSKDLSVLCSLTTDMLRNHVAKFTNNSFKLYNIFVYLFWRIIFECNESKYWKTVYKRFDVNSNLNIVRRNITSLVLWIGTIEKENLMKEQLIALSNYTIDGYDAVIGYGADEYTFSCNEESTKCLSHQSKVSKYLPRSSMNLMKVGWRCAQRRPLRALAHILLLFNPYFVVVADDDTLVNYKLLIHNFGHILYNHTYSDRTPYVIGEFIGSWGEHGHLTLKGFYGGGSGYVLSHLVLQKLIIEEIAYWDTSITAGNYSHRSSFQIKHLSMLDDGIINLKHCISTDYSTCIGRNTTMSKIPIDSNIRADNFVIPIGVRLIDYCVNLLANENTCYHSDHSLGRCIVYGINLHPLGSVCMSQVLNPPKDILVGMCFSAPECDLNQRVTCHRYKTGYDNNGNIISIRTTKNHGHYKSYSSIFDGISTDQFV